MSICSHILRRSASSLDRFGEVSEGNERIKSGGAVPAAGPLIRLLSVMPE